MEFSEIKEKELLALFTFLEKKDLSEDIRKNWNKPIKDLMSELDKKYNREYNRFLMNNRIETTTEKPVPLFNVLTKEEFIFYIKDRYSTEEEKK